MKKNLFTLEAQRDANNPGNEGGTNSVPIGNLKTIFIFHRH